MEKINDNHKRLVAITAAATTIILVVSIAAIGAAPFSTQQPSSSDRAPGPSITSGNIVDGEVRNQDLADDAVTTEKIQDGQVTTDDLADDAVTSGKIRDGEVTSEDVADGTITSTDIAEGTIPPPAGGIPDDNSVTSAKIVDGEVKSVDIGDGEVNTQDLADGSVTRSKMGSDAIIMPNVHAVTGNLAKIEPLAEGTSTADCPDGEIVIGGGYETAFFGGFNDLEVTDSFPVDENSWRVVARNEGIGLLATIEGLVAVAMCMGPSPP
jgi:hypothetical protein